MFHLIKRIPRKISTIVFPMTTRQIKNLYRQFSNTCALPSLLKHIAISHISIYINKIYFYMYILDNIGSVLKKYPRYAPRKFLTKNDCTTHQLPVKSIRNAKYSDFKREFEFLGINTALKKNQKIYFTLFYNIVIKNILNSALFIQL